MKRIDPLKFYGEKIFDHIDQSAPSVYTITNMLEINLPPYLHSKKDFYATDILYNGWHGTLIIKRGFEFDGASGPAIDGVGNMLAAICHDALYRLIYHYRFDGFTYKQADQFYRDICIAQGAGRFRARLHYIGLRLFGWIHRAISRRKE